MVILLTFSFRCEVNLDDFNSEHCKKWDGYNVYKESKLALAAFAKELSERVKGTSSLCFFLISPFIFIQLFAKKIVSRKKKDAFYD